MLPVNNTASRCSNNSNVLHPFYKIIIQKVWSTILLKNNIFIYGFCKFIFPRVYCCTIKTESIIFLSKVFYSWSISKTIGVYSNFPFNFFWNCLLMLSRTFYALLYFLFNTSHTCIQNIICWKSSSFCDLFLSDLL